MASLHYVLLQRGRELQRETSLRTGQPLSWTVNRY